VETLEAGYYVGEEGVRFRGGKVCVEFVTKVIGDGDIVNDKGRLDDLTFNPRFDGEDLSPPVSTESRALSVRLWRISDIDVPMLPSQFIDG
jgi:hypothetical protein